MNLFLFLRFHGVDGTLKIHVLELFISSLLFAQYLRHDAQIDNVFFVLRPLNLGEDCMTGVPFILPAQLELGDWHAVLLTGVSHRL